MHPQCQACLNACTVHPTPKMRKCVLVSKHGEDNCVLKVCIHSASVFICPHFSVQVVDVPQVWPNTLSSCSLSKAVNPMKVKVQRSKYKCISELPSHSPPWHFTWSSNSSMTGSRAWGIPLSRTNRFDRSLLLSSCTITLVCE